MTDREQELEEQLRTLLALVEHVGETLSTVDAIFDRWYVRRKYMREVIRKHGELGRAMALAVKRTRERVFADG